MDPISQGAFGASLSQSFAAKKSKQFAILIIGWLSGMAPDLDVFIRSKEDPLLFLQFHRQFTHSLIFIPFGALLCAALLFPFFKKSFKFREITFFSFFGYATHGLLDSCTSYGTQLFWPFSNMRVAWNNVSIVDPLFTIPILVMVILAAWKNKRILARWAFGYSLFYLLLGVIQNYRAQQAGLELAKKRGHFIKNISAKLSIGNLFLWKTVYRYKGRFYVDAIHNFGPSKIYEGHSIKELNIKEDFPFLQEGTRQWNDILRFSWFSMGHVAKDPLRQNFIMDVRYSMIPNSIKPLWGIQLNPKKLNEHVQFIQTRALSSQQIDLFKKMFLKK
jgi:inner membrane protein